MSQPRVQAPSMARGFPAEKPSPLANRLPERSPPIRVRSTETNPMTDDRWRPSIARIASSRHRTRCCSSTPDSCKLALACETSTSTNLRQLPPPSAAPTELLLVVAAAEAEVRISRPEWRQGRSLVGARETAVARSTGQSALPCPRVLRLVQSGNSVKRRRRGGSGLVVCPGRVIGLAPEERHVPPRTADRSEGGAGIVRLAGHAADRQEPYAIGPRQELAPRGRPDADDVVGV
jgi:hypothetical protein